MRFLLARLANLVISHVHVQSQQQGQCLLGGPQYTPYSGTASSATHMSFTGRSARSTHSGAEAPMTCARARARGGPAGGRPIDVVVLCSAVNSPCAVSEGEPLVPSGAISLQALFGSEA